MQHPSYFYRPYTLPVVQITCVRALKGDSSVKALKEKLSFMLCISLLLLWLAPLRVRSATGCQQPPEWSVVGSGPGRLHRSIDSPWESRSFCTVFIQVIRGRPGGLFQYTEGEEVKICFASTLSSIQAICPNRVRRRAWIISVSRGWLVWRRTSSLEMKWYHLMPRSIQSSKCGSDWQKLPSRSYLRRSANSLASKLHRSRDFI